MHRENQLSEQIAGGRASIRLLACNCICAVAVLQHMHASRSPPKILDTGPSDGAPNKPLPAINRPALQRLSFSIVICFVEAVIPPSSIGIAHFSTTQHLGRRQKNFGER